MFESVLSQARIAAQSSPILVDLNIISLNSCVVPIWITMCSSFKFGGLDGTSYGVIGADVYHDTLDDFS